jgi:hypothetical protein
MKGAFIKMETGEVRFFRAIEGCITTDLNAMKIRRNEYYVPVHENINEYG